MSVRSGVVFASAVLLCLRVLACNNGYYTFVTPATGDASPAGVDGATTANDASDDAPPALGDDGGSPASDGGAYVRPCDETCDSQHCDEDGGCHPLVFITAATVDGTLTSRFGSGLRGADALCTSEARLAQKTGTYVAWLSTSTMNALDRVSGTAGASRPVWRSDLGEIAPSYHDMIFGSTLLDLIDRTAQEAQVSPADAVWTGTNNRGQSSSNTCGNWAFNGAALAGEIGGLKFDIQWTDEGTATCDKTNHLYCFQIVP